ncbi:MAG TPA: hypothetical protein VD902_06525 [Symbiobacteriaceae bacterium]|nr:hypothetical protein [Symbiobacteriaceae bacterium]
MTKAQPDKDKAARTAVQGLLRTDKMKALAVAVLLASTSGCSAAPQNQPCSGQPGDAPCIQPSGTESGWLNQPSWPAVEGTAGGPQGQHLATDLDFIANPQYTRLRAGNSGSSTRPTYYGGSHYYYYRSGSGTTYGGGSSGSGFSS